MTFWRNIGKKKKKKRFFPPSNLVLGLMTRNTDPVIIETHIINTVSSKSTWSTTGV